MADLSQNKITITTGINDTPKSPPDHPGISVGFLSQKFNDLIDKLQQEIQLLKARVTFFETEYTQSVFEVRTGTMQTIPDDTIFGVEFAVESAGNSTTLVIEELAEPNTVSLLLNDQPINLDYRLTKRGLCLYWIPDWNNVTTGDILKVLYSGSDGLDRRVTIYIQ